MVKTSKAKIKSDKKQVPIDASIMKLSSFPHEEPHLLASRCRRCGEIYFPQKAACSNCFQIDMEEVALSSKGEVYSSTVITMAPPLYEGPVPYSIGVVKLPEGVLVPTVFMGCDLTEPLKIGSKVKVAWEKFEEDEEGNEVITYKFQLI